MNLDSGVFVKTQGEKIKVDETTYKLYKKLDWLKGNYVSNQIYEMVIKDIEYEIKKLIKEEKE